jgi:cell division protease FtsH
MRGERGSNRIKATARENHWIKRLLDPEDFTGIAIFSCVRRRQVDFRKNAADGGVVDDAKAEPQELVKGQREIWPLGRAHSQGVLLVGPQGTGKALVAKAVAGQAGFPFFSISGSEFVKMFVGLGAARVLHHFIDELDALGKARGGGTFGGHDEKEQTFNRLLTELDGFDRREGIVLLGATNRPEVLDPALLRAGRFDRRVVLDRPDRKGREAILKVHTKRITLAADVRLDEIAGRALAAPICPISNCGSKVPARSRGTSICARHPPFWRSPRCSYCRCPIKLASMAQLATTGGL